MDTSNEFVGCPTVFSTPKNLGTISCFAATSKISPANKQHPNQHPIAESAIPRFIRIAPHLPTTASNMPPNAGTSIFETCTCESTPKVKKVSKRYVTAITI